MCRSAVDSCRLMCRRPATPTHMYGPPPLSHCHSIEAALAGRSFVPAWDRLQQEAPNPGQPLVLAEALQCDSGTEGGCWAGVGGL